MLSNTTKKILYTFFVIIVILGIIFLFYFIIKNKMKKKEKFSSYFYDDLEKNAFQIPPNTSRSCDTDQTTIKVSSDNYPSEPGSKYELERPNFHSIPRFNVAKKFQKTLPVFGALGLYNQAVRSDLDMLTTIDGKIGQKYNEIRYKQYFPTILNSINENKKKM